MTVAAPAKVNLWLRVGDREPDGFHGIDTLFCALQLADTVIVRTGERGGDPTLDTAYASPLDAPPDLGPDQSNLALRAARAFVDRAGLGETPEIRLVKRIPAGAGLGGGSSDAAAVLRALHRLHPRRLATDALRELAIGLGSDVPFFLAGRPFARGTGRGERLEPVPAPPARPVVVALPPFPVPTAGAYGWLDEDREADADSAGDTRGTVPLSELSWDRVAERAGNDFEGPVFRRYPVLARIRDTLRDQGARPALLAGSGSTVFGVFAEKAAAHRAAGKLREEQDGLRVVVTRTRVR